MPSGWLILTGAPSLSEVIEGSKHTPHHYKDVVPGTWQDLHEAVLPDATSVHNETTDPSVSALEPAYDNDIFQHEEDEDEASRQGRQANTTSMLSRVEPSRSVQAIERSRSLAVPQLAGWSHASRGDPSADRVSNDQGDASASMDIVDSQEDTDTMLPPPTQYLSRFDRSANQTTEQSLVNLPSWGFSLSSITSLSSLPPVSRGMASSTKVNLLVCIKDLDPPFTVQLKRPSAKTGKNTSERASLSVFDDSGIALPIVLWDDYATQWAGEHLLVGDIIYLEKISLGEYLGQRQGTAVEGSRVQICYRTVRTGRKSDRDYRPDLDLAWDPVSSRVKALKELVMGEGYR